MMYNMEEVRPSIERLTLAIASTLKLEVAIFDRNSRLFFCTPTYLKKKGKVVHAPSIKEVMNNGSVLVNRPGEMPSCIGCRFKDHCPSTIEILCCIRVGAEVVGVADLTSFTKEGQRRIEENTPVYLNAVTELGNLIGDCLQSVSGERNLTALDSLLQSTLEISNHPMLLADPHGVVLHYNQLAARLFKSCGSTAASLWQIFPEETVQKLLKGSSFFERSVTIGKGKAKITSRAVMSGGQVSAVLVRFSDELVTAAEEHEAAREIVGSSEEIENVRRMVNKLANSPTPILLTGETGTGKELVARAMHNQSRRSKYPFVAINCSSIPENLFESELFGYEEGSFTGAKKGGKMGKIELAQGGTLFLDELGEMPLSVQPKLLRVLQEYELERVGSTEKIHLDIRVIAATNRNLKDLIREGKFREDLYYRISVINLPLPPLRERKSDILPIAQNFLDKLRDKLDMPLKTISPQAQELLLEYDWPGNVRELQNAMEYAANLCEREVLLPDDLPRYVSAKQSACPQEKSHAANQEMVQIKELLGRYGYTLEGKKLVAAQLGISLRTLYRKLNQFQLDGQRRINKP